MTARCAVNVAKGEGGIVLSPKDLKRLYEGLNLEKQAFLDAYGVFRNGKWQVRTGEDGNCIFFRAGQSCTVHAIKPDVCRAWPFFRGNMADAEKPPSGQGVLPRYTPCATHEEFVEEGQSYLEENGS